jgi:amino acid adenylation domain-containing protein/thioester reductase-like protein
MDPKNQIQALYPLSPMQEGMLFDWLLDKHSGAYFEQIALDIKGDLNPETLRQSFQSLSDRHETLRSIFVYEKIKNPRQVVLKERIFPFEFRDISSLSPEEKKSFMEDFKKSERENGFELSKDSLSRASLFKTGESTFFLFWNFHHIILDGWCLGVVFSDLLEIYQALKNNLPDGLPPAVPYKNYIDWLSRQDMDEASAYWKKYLEGFDTLSRTPILKRAADRNFEPLEYFFILEEPLVEGIQKIARENSATPGTVFQTIWGILLARYNNADDAVFGSVVSGRNPEINGIEKMVGLFINTIPFRVSLTGNSSFSNLIQKTQKEWLSSEKFNFYPMAKIRPANTKEALIDHVVAFENYPLDQAVRNWIEGKEGLDFTVESAQLSDQTNYSFNILVVPGREWKIKFTYNAFLLDPKFIHRIEGHIRQIIKSVLQNPEIKASDIDILSPEEREEILYRFNDTKADFPRDKTVHQLFMEQAAKTPAAIALVFEDQKMTYRELDRKSNQAARVLRDKGVKPDDIIAIMVERSFEMIVGILAILKAGGAYLPIDPDYPEERISYMLTDSHAKILLTQSFINSPPFQGAMYRACRDRAGGGFDGETLSLDDPSLYRNDPSPLENGNRPTDLVYVIYTSGSTGKPKGVLLEHRNIVNLIYFEYQKTQIPFYEKVLQFASSSFDVCYQEIFSTLLSGGQLVISNKEEKRDIKKLYALIEQNKISVIFFPTSYLKFILNEPEYQNALPACVRHIITAGEQLILNNKSLDLIHRNEVILHNHYGPSETHVVTTFVIDSAEKMNEIPPIGKPISNNKILILNKNQLIQPVGCAGELFISGENVGRGYLNQPELTAEKFVPNPFAPGERLYKTGDLARWLPDGNIEFLGRIDHQVKIRGFRIELGEIESALLSCPAVKETLVTAREDANGNKSLCAYVVSEGDFSIPELRERLLKSLPEYMVPAYFVRLDKMPLNRNGKIDRKALPEPSGDSMIKKEYAPARNETDEALCKIWTDVLGIEKIGIEDNFFDLGGNSLLIIRVLGALFPFKLGLRASDFYEAPTIRGLSDIARGKPRREEKDKKEEPIFARQAFEKPGEVMLSGEKTLYQSILLTGVTGYLGIHLLEELLQTTDAKIACLIRGESQEEAQTRLLSLLEFYFPGKYPAMPARIKILLGDVSLERLGLSDTDYEAIGRETDAVFHSAAIVRHIGNYAEFASINVEGTRRIARFAIDFPKRMHYISTTGVAGDYMAKQREKRPVFSENDFYIGQNYLDHVYMRTKFEAENLLFHLMEEGLKASIYRVGNLSERQSDGHFQKNIGENRIRSLIKAVLTAGLLPSQLEKEGFEFTPVDACARAVVSLSRIKESENKVFHLFNYRQPAIGEFLRTLSEILGGRMETLSNPTFEEYIRAASLKNIPGEAIELLKSGFNFEQIFSDDYRVNMDYRITEGYLKQLGFEWPEINREYLEKIARYWVKSGFINE